MLDNLEKEFEEFKNLIDILPENTSVNKNKKLSVLDTEEEKNEKLISEVSMEIESRIEYLKHLEVNPEIEKFEEELEKCSIVNEWNIFNTSYEKMHLDYYLYNLEKYYNDDFNSLNTCIKLIVNAFKKVNILLSKDDFNYNSYVAEYMDKIINEVSDEELKNAFEDYYWKYPEIITTLMDNIKSIYYKKEKLIDKYYEGRHQEFIKTHSDKELDELRFSIYDNIKYLKGTDKRLIFDKFLSGEYSIGMFNQVDIDKLKRKYFTEDNYTYDNLVKLYKTLLEYNMIIKNDHMLEDMKKRIENKDTFKGIKDNTLKEISKLEDQLLKVINKQNSKSLFKKNNNEELFFEYKNLLSQINNKFKELDEYNINDIINKRLSKDCKIVEVLQTISSHYIYFVNQYSNTDVVLDYSDINNRFLELKREVRNNSFVLINSIALLDEKQMKQMIVSKYKLENIQINIENLDEDNIDNTLAELEKLITYNHIIFSEIDLDNVSLYLEYKKYTS